MAWVGRARRSKTGTRCRLAAQVQNGRLARGQGSVRRRLPGSSPSGLGCSSRVPRGWTEWRRAVTLGATSRNQPTGSPLVQQTLDLRSTQDPGSCGPVRPPFQGGAPAGGPGAPRRSGSATPSRWESGRSRRRKAKTDADRCAPGCSVLGGCLHSFQNSLCGPGGLPSPPSPQGAVLQQKGARRPGEAPGARPSGLIPAVLPAVLRRWEWFARGEGGATAPRAPRANRARGAGARVRSRARRARLRRGLRKRGTPPSTSSRLWQPLAACPWEKYSPSLGLGFLACKTGAVTQHRPPGVAVGTKCARARSTARRGVRRGPGASRGGGAFGRCGARLGRCGLREPLFRTGGAGSERGRTPVSAAP